MIAIPIAISYDHVPESDSYADMLMGRKKAPESMWGVMRLVYDLTIGKYTRWGKSKIVGGNVHVAVAQPLRLTGAPSEFASALQVSLSATAVISSGLAR